MTERNYENEYWEAQAHISLLEGENKELSELLDAIINPLLEDADDNPTPA